MKPEWDLLLSAAQKNLPDRIRELVQVEGVDPSHANSVGQSALHIAALWGHVESVQALVKLGANVNAQNNMTGATPLHMVAQSQKAGFEARLKVVDVLLEAGAAADQADNYGSLPVHAFQLTGKGDITEAALDDQTRRFVAKLQPRRPDIHVAIVERDLSKLEQVLANDSSIANSTITASQGLTPVSLTVDELLGIVSADKAKEQEVDTLLDILKALLTNGADANGGVDESAIAAAVVTGGEANEPPLHKVVCMLREYYKKAERDESASSAIRTLNTVVDILVGAGATISSDTSLLLHQAARFNELAFARFLIDGLHVDPNTKGRQGMTPLQFAARSGQVEMLRFLLEQPGIDVNAKDDRGSTALDAARVNQKEEIVSALKEYA